MKKIIKKIIEGAFKGRLPYNYSGKIVSKNVINTEDLAENFFEFLFSADKEHNLGIKKILFKLKDEFDKAIEHDDYDIIEDVFLDLEALMDKVAPIDTSFYSLEDHPDIYGFWPNDMDEDNFEKPGKEYSDEKIKASDFPEFSLNEIRKIIRKSL